MSGYESPRPEDEIAPDAEQTEASPSGDQEAAIAGGLGVIPPNPGAPIPPIAAADVDFDGDDVDSDKEQNR